MGRGLSPLRTLSSVLAFPYVVALLACGSGSGASPVSQPIQAERSQGAPAAATAPLLRSAGSFAVLGASTVTNTGSSTIVGDLGVSPGLAITGFPPGLVSGGTTHKGDAVALQAQADVTAAFVELAARSCTANLTGKDLGGMTLVPGVYCFASSAQLTGTLILDAQGKSDAVFVFQIGTTLTTASGSAVRMANGAGACNAYWQVGSSATLGTTTAFTGNILALASITLNTGASISGRALARTGAVTLDTNHVAASACAGPECVGGTQCGSACTTLGTDPRNCGTCGNACGLGESCTGGSCSCAAGKKCGGSCTDLGSDAKNCGACGHACTADESCAGGVCKLSCCSGTSACGSSCLDLTTDANNCGACGKRCTASQFCAGGACVGCPPSRAQCAQQCADLTSDPFNCGACGTACAGSQSCIAGVCKGCDGTLCSNTCVELRTDAENCGACGHVCAAGDCCVAGACTLKPAGGVPGPHAPTLARQCTRR
ncbi:MAG: hypothetical protein NVS4B10_11680 [Myxococcales bacterium]